MDAELFSVDRLVQVLDDYVVPFGVNVLLAIAVFFAGRWGARLATRILARLLRRVRTEESLIKLIGDLAYALLLTIVVIAALERVGVKTTAAVAVIGAAGLAIGMALQGSLGNFASGVLIMLFKPYRVGDTVLVAGKLGTVESVHVFHTVLYTSDMRVVIVPNGAITAASIENFSTPSTRRIELVFSVEYGHDLDGARAALESAVVDDARVLRDPPPEVTLVELAETKVSFAVRATVKPEDFAQVTSELIERVKRELDQRLITAKAA